MKTSHIFYLEVSRPPRFLTWPLILLSAATIATWGGGELPEVQHDVFAFFIFVGAFCTMFVLELGALAIEVSETEVRFRVSVLYWRRIPIREIQHWEVRTYLSTDYPGTIYRARLAWRPPRHCVELTMRDGAIITLTSAHAEHLAHAIEQARGILLGHGAAKAYAHQNLPG
jgi:hypothetical protein